MLGFPEGDYASECWLVGYTSSTPTISYT